MYKYTSFRCQIRELGGPGFLVVTPPCHDRLMCMMCNGASRDDVLFHVHASIERVGWAVVPVVSGTVARSWAYTIGLSSGFGHPELVVVGRRPDSAGLLLNSLGEMVRAGESLSPGEWILGPNDERLELKEVPHGHFTRETFALGRVLRCPRIPGARTQGPGGLPDRTRPRA